jgi:hypothetical protein
LYWKINLLKTKAVKMTSTGQTVFSPMNNDFSGSFLSFFQYQAGHFVVSIINQHTAIISSVREFNLQFSGTCGLFQLRKSQNDNRMDFARYEIDLKLIFFAFVGEKQRKQSEPQTMVSISICFATFLASRKSIQ